MACGNPEAWTGQSDPCGGPDPENPSLPPASSPVPPSSSSNLFLVSVSVSIIGITLVLPIRSFGNTSELPLLYGGIVLVSPFFALLQRLLTFSRCFSLRFALLINELRSHGIWYSSPSNTNTSSSAFQQDSKSIPSTLRICTMV